MNVEDVRAMVAEIDADDPEIAHSKEDLLYQRVLEYIAGLKIYEGEVDGHVVILAREALKTKDINFSRWYA